MTALNCFVHISLFPGICIPCKCSLSHWGSWQSSVCSDPAALQQWQWCIRYYAVWALRWSWLCFVWCYIGSMCNLTSDILFMTMNFDNTGLYYWVSVFPQEPLTVLGSLLATFHPLGSTMLASWWLATLSQRTWLCHRKLRITLSVPSALQLAHLQWVARCSCVFGENFTTEKIFAVTIYGTDRHAKYCSDWSMQISKR